MRTETRRQRYEIKLPKSKRFDINYGTVNLIHEANIAHLSRSAACFGFSNLHVIGGLPERAILKPVSGSLIDYTPIRVFQSEEEYLEAIQGRYLVAIELCSESIPIQEFKFPKNIGIELFTGHEELGVPGVICEKADAIVHIPMPGFGFCLNTSQAANIIGYECLKQLGGLNANISSL